MDRTAMSALLRQRWARRGALLAVLLLLAGCSRPNSPEAPITTPDVIASSAAPTILSVVASIIVHQSMPDGSTGKSCAGEGENAAVKPGAPVMLFDSKGTILATDTLSEGVMADDLPDVPGAERCLFEAQFPDAPAGDVSYGIRIGDGGLTTFTAAGSHVRVTIPFGVQVTEAPPPPELQRWIKEVKEATDTEYAAADAKWACEQLDEAGDEAPFVAVGDERMIWAGRLLCTEHKAAAELAARGFRDGLYAVGTKPGQISAGTYRSQPNTQRCYWERSTAGGATIENDFVNNAPAGVRVTIASSDGGFMTQSCGPWVPLR